MSVMTMRPLAMRKPWGKAEMFFRAAVDAIKRGLQKTAEVFGAGFRSILHGG